jgi:antitoxin component YwqK of YwqJK toxin-antitoxin module
VTKKTSASKRTEVIDGFAIKYHANGKTRWSKGRIAHGQPQGYWEWYRLDGTLKRSGYFEKGEPVGAWTTYDDRGQVYKVTQKARSTAAADCKRIDRPTGKPAATGKRKQ